MKAQPQPGEDRLAQHLRAEADSSRPVFDERLHARIMQGVRQQRHAAPSHGRSSTGWRRWAAVAAVVAVAVTAAMQLRGRQHDVPEVAARGTVPATGVSLWSEGLDAGAALLEQSVGSETIVAETVDVVEDWADIDRDVETALQFVDRFAVTLVLATD